MFCRGCLVEAAFDFYSPSISVSHFAMSFFIVFLSFIRFTMKKQSIEMRSDSSPGLIYVKKYSRFMI